MSSTTIDPAPDAHVRELPSGIADAWRRQAVIDIGSNSVRLVVFEGLVRAPLPIFNERVLCGIGRDLADTGALHEGGVDLALSTIERFVAISREIGAGFPEAVATAAVREAANGREFVARVRETCGLEVRVLSGVDEARLSALGAMSAIPDADGVMGDLGGGSLELVVLNSGEIGDSVTLPLGALRLMGLTPEERIAVIDQALDEVAWLNKLKKRNFYGVGGAWRSLARIHMAQREYPLRIVHQYQITRGEANTLAGVISGLSLDSLARIEGVNRRRLESLPGAAAVLSRTLRRLRPGRVMFLAGGLREGLLQQYLSEEVRGEDPLISQCRAFAVRASRFGDTGDELADWMAPLFDEESPEDGRLRLAACLLSDVAWRAHPSYRAARAFEEVFQAPVVGIDHAGRAFVALAIHARYNGTGDAPVTEPARTLVEQAIVEQAKLVGVSLRLGLTLSGGAPGVLARTRLERSAGEVTLHMRRKDSHLNSELVERRLASVARCLDLAPRCRIRGR
ncbi:MAG: Ppx/GppA family phosphatase [Alphaproteobacteria bacterium]|nr:Ppx/GppA family phosphatase [Alphaproteobacteria bacterium]MCY4495687.1 Ppx/GppA family phosphatase [Rhodospirillaceae bacterium]